MALGGSVSIFAFSSGHNVPGIRQTLNRSRFVRFYGSLPKNLYRQSAASLRAKIRPAGRDAAPAARRLAEEAREKGYAILENFWPADKARALGEELSAQVDIGEDCALDCGATVKVNFKAWPDGSTRRIYGVDKLVPELLGLRFDPLMLSVPAVLDRIPYTSLQLVYEQNIVGEPEPGPWHFDTFYPEWKAMLYLGDVDRARGATAYIPGSHRDRGHRLRHQWLGYFSGREVRFFPAESLGGRADEAVSLEAPAGALVIFDGRGLHRIMPRTGGCRRMLVNYLAYRRGSAQKRQNN